MGNAASKGLRKLPKTQSKEVPRATESLNRIKSRGGHEDSNVDTSMDSSMKDGQDPDFSKNLAKIDPVKINKIQTNFKPSDKMVNILKGRKIENELENASMAYNRLTAQSMLIYLQERKGDVNIGQLNRSFNVDDGDIDIISKYTAAPTTGKPFTVKVDEERGEIERVIVSL